MAATRMSKFRAACLRNLAALGLGDWRVDFTARPLDPDKIAETTIDLNQKTARFNLNPKLGRRDGKGYDLDDTAAHEVLHVAFAEMLSAAASSHNDRSRRVEALEHALINRLAALISDRV